MRQKQVIYWLNLVIRRRRRILRPELALDPLLLISSYHSDSTS